MSHTDQRNIATPTGVFDSEIRTLSYAMVNASLAQHAIIAEALEMRPAKVLVYLTIIAATAQKFMRAPGMTDELRAGALIPADRFGRVSRRAIAAATGMPNENVRRIVNELIVEGLVIVEPSGGLRNVGGNFQNARIVASLRALLAENIRLQQVLLDAGAVAVEPGE